MTTDPREIVEAGYDVAADDYAHWVAGNIDPGRAKYLDLFCDRLSEGVRVLDLGCGGGGPTTERLARRFALTGIDLSATQVERARERVPSATFMQADMTRFEVAPGSLDGVAAFYSLIHLPYGELPSMIVRLAGWLTAGGVFVACFGARSAGEHVEPQWLGGAPMYWSTYAQADTLRYIEDAGLAVVETSVEVAREDGEDALALWVLATKRPVPGAAQRW